MDPTESDGANDISIAPERVMHVLNMVKKKANAALSGQPGVHFRVYPPPEFLAHPDVIETAGAYDKLKGTVWWVRWYDDQYDPLGFIEFLAFIDQIIAAQRAFQKAAQSVSSVAGHRASKHAGGWQPKKDRSRTKKPKPMQITVKGGLDIPALVANDRVRDLFGAVTLESTVRPDHALN